MLLLEAYVLDFDGDLYGQAARVRFTHRLRGQERFDDVDDLDRPDGTATSTGRARPGLSGVRAVPGPSGSLDR